MFVLKTLDVSLFFRKMYIFRVNEKIRNWGGGRIVCFSLRDRMQDVVCTIIFYTNFTILTHAKKNRFVWISRSTLLKLSRAWFIHVSWFNHDFRLLMVKTRGGKK